MIKAIRANHDSFRAITFEPGFNVVLADKTHKSSRKDSRNGAGKSLIVEIIHFCLGGKAGTSLKKKALTDWEFTLELEIEGRTLSVTRSLAHPKNVYIDGLPESEDSKTTSFFEDGIKLSNADWARQLGSLMFGLPIEKSSAPFTPRFRSLFPFFARSGRDAFTSPFRHFRNMKIGEQQIYNSYLLGLGWEYARQWQVLRERGKLLNAFKSAAQTGAGYLSSGTVGELEAERVRLEQATGLAEKNLASFKIHPEYEKIEEQASTLTKELHELSNRNVSDTALLDHYRRSISEESGSLETERASRTLEEAYAEAGVILPELVKRRLEDVKEFHGALVRGRREFLSSEIARLDREIIERKQKVVLLDQQRADLMRILETHGALEEYNRLQDRKQAAADKLADVRRRIQQIKELEDGRSKLKIDLETLAQTTRHDLDDRSTAKELAISLFNSNSEALYDAPGNLIIDIGKNGYNLDVEIQRTGATGIENMKVFCYDLTLAQIWARYPVRPGILLHDSPMFDGVDERQKAQAWLRAKAESERLGIQYICMVNTDDIPNDQIMDGLNMRDAPHARIVLTDQIDGCLLGVRF